MKRGKVSKKTLPRLNIIGIVACLRKQFRFKGNQMRLIIGEIAKFLGVSNNQLVIFDIKSKVC